MPVARCTQKFVAKLAVHEILFSIVFAARQTFLQNLISIYFQNWTLFYLERTSGIYPKAFQENRYLLFVTVYIAFVGVLATLFHWRLNNSAIVLIQTFSVHCMYSFVHHIPLFSCSTNCPSCISFVSHSIKCVGGVLGEQEKTGTLITNRVHHNTLRWSFFFFFFPFFCLRLSECPFNKLRKRLISWRIRPKDFGLVIIIIIITKTCR